MKEASEAAAKLGSIRTPRKAKSSKENLAKANKARAEKKSTTTRKEK
jgi:hypothetical protein